MTFQIGTIKITVDMDSISGNKKIGIEMNVLDGNKLKVTIENNPESNQQMYVAIALWKAIDQ